MPHEFAESEPELEPQAGAARSGGPPRKFTGAAVLDPPVPPKGPVGPLHNTLGSSLLRVFAVIALIGIGAAIFLMLFRG